MIADDRKNSKYLLRILCFSFRIDHINYTNSDIIIMNEV